MIGAMLQTTIPAPMPATHDPTPDKLLKRLDLKSKIVHLVRLDQIA
jgi:hypothetical protein